MLSIGDRMKKNYERVTRIYLSRRTPVIMRIDGRAFHTATKDCKKPFDDDLNTCLVRAMQHLCKEEIQGAKLGYCQSDEVSILITDFDKLNTEAWFDYNIQKMCSVGASIFTAIFNNLTEYEKPPMPQVAMFDCRVFNIPKEEVVNYFVWRQKDWERNSIHMLARSLYSHKECMDKSCAELQEMIHAKGENWADLEDKWKNGTVVMKDEEVTDDRWITGSDVIFSKHRDGIETLLEPLEE